MDDGKILLVMLLIGYISGILSGYLAAKEK